MVTLLRRARADLARPATPVDRDPFLVVAAVVIVVVAQVTRPGSWWEVAALVPAAVALLALGLGVRVPLELLAGLAAVSTLVAIGNRGRLELAMFLPVLSSLYAAWYLGSLIRATAVLVAAVASVVAAVTYLAPEAGINWVPWTTAILFIFMMGLTLRQQRLLIDQLNEAREALSRQAVADERRRIARELHDLAGHTLAAMLLHVTGARHVLGRDPGEARRALVDAETVGRASLDQIRATVAALRTDERGTDRALAGSADLGDLVEAYRRAGLAVELHLDGPVDRLDGPLGTALHRITQEALTNVARHAPGNEVVVAVAAGPAEVRLTVTDQGRAPTPATTTDGGPHFGLVGMRERARALGGDLEAGPHQDGWRVASILPLVGGPVDRGATG